MLKKVLLGSLLWMGFTPFAFADINQAQVACAAGHDAVKWYRDSAERNAIYREVFAMAENILRQKVASQHLKPKQWGVILDIDETVLDNSVWDYQHEAHFDQNSWNQFATQGKSLANPGAKQFIDDIHQMGGYINLVSNRSAVLQQATEKNLKDQGIYYDQVLLDTVQAGPLLGNKNPRFNAVIAGKAPSKLPAQHVLAWFGDNIQDFPNEFQRQIEKENPNGSAYQKFGAMYFVLPNPMYGSWQANSFK